MKFNVEIDMGEFSKYYGRFDDEAFANEIKARITKHISDEISNRWCNDLGCEISKIANEIIENELDKDDLKTRIIEVVADKIVRKRDLRALCTSDTKNREFIEEVVNDCLRKKLGG